MSRWPQSWLGRAVWAMIGIAAFWVAYQFGANYMDCRATDFGKATCIGFAFWGTGMQVFLHVVNTIVKLLSIVLP